MARGTSRALRIGSTATLAAALCLAPLAARAQERTIAMVPSAGGVLQVRILAQGERIAVTVATSGRSTFSALLAPDEAMHLAAALKEAADSTVARRSRQSNATPASEEMTYFVYQVDSEAELIPGSLAPVYPASLAGRGLPGVVDAMFVVDTTGRVVPQTLRIVHPVDPLFRYAFSQAIASAHFVPALKAGRKVRELVALKYTFTDSR